MGTGNSSGKAIAEVQPCGFAVVLAEDWRVTNVSASISEHFVGNAAAMVGQPLADHFGASTVHALRNQLALMRDTDGSARMFSLVFAGVPKSFDVAMHLSGGKIILEAVPSAHPEAGDPAGTVRQLASRLDGCTSADDVMQRGARLMRALTGFESVTLFRGTQPVAHDARGNLGPLAQCPSPGLRLVANAGADHSPLDPDCDASLLDRAILRCPGDAERDPMQADGVSAMLAVPMRCAGGHWGMAVGRNRGAHRPAFERIAAAELFAEMLAMRAELCELRSPA